MRLLVLLFLQAADPGALSQQAKTAMAAGRFDEAIGLYSQILKSLPGHPGILLNLCLANHSAGHYAEAVKQCGLTLQKDPKMIPANLFLGAAELKLDRPERAVQPLERYHAAQPNQPVGQLELATAYMMLARFGDAIKLYDALAINTPNDPRVFHGLGRAHVDLSRQIYARLTPGSAPWAALLARTKFEDQQYKAAAELYRQALKMQPDFPGAHAALAEIYRQTNEPALAEAEAKLEKNFPPSGAFAEAIGHSAKALDAFQKLEALPPSPELFDIKAESASMKGQHADAAANYKKAFEMKPSEARYERKYALSLSANREFEIAIPLLKKHAMPFELGAALLESGDAQSALAPLQAEFKKNPVKPGLRGLLGRALLAAEQPAAALPHLMAAKANDPDGAIHLQLSRAYQRLGRSAEAAEALNVYQSRQAATAPR
ncbi:MAG: tetratricopeptide repeat protein [Acidobacteria bacterium]|nr:tetratricopeptide repeat protein [Acidobacteriota bacterium]